MWKFILLIARLLCMVTGRSLSIVAVEQQHIPTTAEPNMVKVLRPLRVLLLALSPVAGHVRNSASLRFSSPKFSDGPDPGDWRAFRAKLVSGQLNVLDNDGNGAGEKEVEIQSVAPRNEALLKNQSEDLWREYLEGAWAHEIGAPEVGGLIAHMPDPAQIISRMQDDSEGSALGESLLDRLMAELAPTENISSSKGLIASWTANTVTRAYMYRVAETLLKETGQALSSMLKPDPLGGRVVIEMNSLTPDIREFVKLSMDGRETWQAVALVLNVDADRDEEVVSVVLNRPASFSINVELAELLLNGMREGLTRQYSDAFVERFLEAFGRGAVYVGGPKNQDMPGTLIHGFNLTGATEIAPGTRIFKGGVEAAVDAVLSGERSPLDFRWFVGHRLDTSLESSRWRSIACARPVALKQCIQLPKPLWHEVLELCSGDLAEISKRELTHRDDLTSDESPDNDLENA